MAEIKEVKVKITADPSNFKHGIDEAKKSTSGMTSVLDGFISKLGPAALGAAAIGAGKLILDIAGKFDEASSDIAKTTGATGSALRSLRDDLAGVMAGGVEQDIKDVSKAMAGLNVAFGVAGEELQDLTRFVGAFADNVGVDMDTAVNVSSKLLKKWGLDAKDLPGTLDLLQVAVQKTKVPFNELAGAVTQGGAQFKAAGISMLDATAMIGAFAQAGVETSVVVSSLNIAIKGLVKDGKDAKIGIKELFDSIKNAKTDTEATTIAAEKFGRQGIAMGDAIRSGTVSIDDLTTALRDAKGAVEATDKASETMGDKMKVAFNKMDAALAPFSNALNDLLANTVDWWATFIGENKSGVTTIQALMETQRKKEEDDAKQHFDELNKQQKEKIDKEFGAQLKADIAKLDAIIRMQGTEAKEAQKQKDMILKINKSYFEDLAREEKESAERSRRTTDLVAEYAKQRAMGLSYVAPKAAEAAKVYTEAEISAWQAAQKSIEDKYQSLYKKLKELRLEDLGDSKETLRSRAADEIRELDALAEKGPERMKLASEARILIEKKLQADISAIDEKGAKDRYKKYAELADAEDERVEKEIKEREETKREEFAKTMRILKEGYTAGFSVMSKINDRFGLGLDDLLEKTENITDGVAGLIASGGTDIASWGKLAVVAIDLIGDAWDALSGKETEAQKKEREAREERLRKMEEERQAIEKLGRDRLANKVELLEAERLAEINKANSVGASVLNIERYYAREILKAKRALNEMVEAENKRIADATAKIEKDAVATRKKLGDENHQAMMDEISDFEATAKAERDAVKMIQTGQNSWIVDQADMNRILAKQATDRAKILEKWSAAWVETVAGLDEETRAAIEDLENGFLDFESRAMEATQGIGNALVSGLKSGSTRDEFKTSIKEMLKGMAIDAAILAAGVADQFEAIGAGIAGALADGVLSQGELDAIDSSINSLYDDTVALVQPIIDLFNSATNTTGGAIAGANVMAPVSGSMSVGTSGALGAVQGSTMGGVTINLNSPLQPTPLETTRAVTTAMQNIAFSTGGV